MGVSNSWRVYRGKSYQNGCSEGTPLSGNLQIQETAPERAAKVPNPGDIPQGKECHVPKALLPLLDGAAHHGRAVLKEIKEDASKSIATSNQHGLGEF